MKRLLVAAMLVGASLTAPFWASASPGRAVRVEHHIVDDAPALGPRDALVTIELFFTPGAPNAHDAYRTLKELQEKKHPTRLRAVFRPLHRNQNTPDIVLAAHQRDPRLFFELMDALSAGSLVPSQTAALELAVKIGLSRSAAERAHLNAVVQAALDANERRRKLLGSTSVPEFVVNGRPLSPTVYASTATVENLDVQYSIALDDARRAVGQGIPAHALVLWGERRERCGDDDFDGDGSITGDGDDDEEQKDDEPPTFAWRLASLLIRGTGCAIATHVPATVDDYNPDAPPRTSDAPLLARPLPQDGLPTVGSPDADVVMFVVCNLKGRNCHTQLDLARRLSEEHFPGLVRAVWVPWVDLALDGAEQDLTLAEATICATAKGEGWDFLTHAGTASVHARSRVDLSIIAANAGLDADALLACAGGQPKRARAAVEAARAAGIGYGPTVVIGGRAYLSGFHSSDDRPAIERVMAELAPGLLEALVPSW